MLDRLARTYIAPRPMQGHRAWSNPLTSYRRPAIVQREPQLPLERTAK